MPLDLTNYANGGKPVDIAKRASIHVIKAGIECRFLMWFVLVKQAPRLPMKAERVEMASCNVGYLFGSSYNMTGITYRLAVPASLCGSKFPPRSLGDGNRHRELQCRGGRKGACPWKLNPSDRFPQNPRRLFTAERIAAERHL